MDDTLYDKLNRLMHNVLLIQEYTLCEDCWHQMDRHLVLENYGKADERGRCKEKGCWCSMYVARTLIDTQLAQEIIEHGF